MFSWQPIYREIADRIVGMESRQDELIELLSTLGEQGLPVVSLKDRSTDGSSIPLADIDPFTFFASFNRSSNETRRSAIIAGIKERWGLASPVPTDYDGIPIVNPMASWYFPYASERTAQDIPMLWSLARQTMEKGPDEIDPGLIDRCLGIKGVGLAKLTMGMFWLRPDVYLAVDQRNIEFFRAKGIRLDESSGRGYLRFLKNVLSTCGEDLVEYSHQAYVADGDKPPIADQTDAETKSAESTLVRAPYFKTYRKTRAMMRILDGVPRAHVLELFRQVNDHVGTPQAQEDWANPDEWIPVRLTGNAREIATRLWTEAEPRLNPRHVRGAFLFAVNHGLLTLDGTGVYRVSADGEKFLDGDRQLIHRIDHIEGLAELLRILSRTQPARRSALLPEWNAFLQMYSKFKSDSTVKASLRERLIDLVDRGFVATDRNYHTLTDAGRAYLAELPDFPLPTSSSDRRVAIERADGEIGVQGRTQKPDRNTAIALADIAAATGLDEALLDRWTRAIHRKGQAILYGPPGTGKTFVARHLADYLVDGGDGIVELVQFHPAYSYEDFVLGIRPQSVDGGLSYPLVPGRFVEFCERAAERAGISVMIIDEINRANLARVFGELMYLLEYRDSTVPLAGGRLFSIPRNVRIVGTMNTADRSIALVDHALRRRFAFLELRPSYETLERFHAGNGGAAIASRLVAALRRLNTEINDHHYEVGISFFMTSELATALPDIWQMEIEPYLQEYFFDRPGTVEKYRWERLEEEIVRER